MITNEGKLHIKRYLAGWVPAIGQSIAFGIGGKAEAASDLALQFEVARADISLTTYDFTTNKLIFKAPVPNDLGGTIYEVGLFSQFANEVSGSYGSRLISSFDSDSETWIDAASGLAATYTSAISRLGGDALTLSPAASAAAFAQLNDVTLDFSGHSAADRFSLAYNISSNTAAVQVRFKKDSTNYYRLDYPIATTGYQINTVTKGSAVTIGAPSWSEVSSIEVGAIATAGGAATVSFDGIRIEDTDSTNPNYVMVSRELLSTPFPKVEGRTQEIEFALDVAV